MTIKNVLFRFAQVYIPLLILAGLVMSHFGIKSSLAIMASTLVLAGCVRWVCEAFKRKNGNDFSANEKITVFWGFLIIDLVSWLVILAVLFSLAPFGLNTIMLKSMSMFVGIVGFFHAITIYVIVGIAKKSHITQ